MNDNCTTVIIERVFSKRGKTLEEIYIDYLARKIAEFEKIRIIFSLLKRKTVRIEFKT